MTKTFVAVGNPRAVQPSRPPLNSILAAAKTAHELDVAHRRAAKAKGFKAYVNRSSNGDFRQRRGESLISFVSRVARLVAVQFRERGKK